MIDIWVPKWIYFYDMFVKVKIESATFCGRLSKNDIPEDLRPTISTYTSPEWETNGEVPFFFELFSDDPENEIKIRVTKYLESLGFIPYYNVDEPTGHGLGEDELFNSIGEILLTLMPSDEDGTNKSEDISPRRTLQDRRGEMIEWLKSNWPKDYQFAENAFVYPEKKEGVDWFYDTI